MRAEERVSTAYNTEDFLEARKVAWMTLNALAATIQVGMNEAEANVLCEKIFMEMGIEKKWHKNRIRFGKNTLLAFRDPSDPKVVLQAKDIFYIDLGPIWKGHEGDVGNTFVLGDDPEMLRCQRDVEEIFYELRKIWIEKTPTGQDLYAQAGRAAESRGWRLNLDLAGHRIGDFPHALWHKGRLSDMEVCPKNLLWILEVQIRHPEREWGAFFEDVLMTGRESLGDTRLRPTGQ
jgi:Xaa-Pro aminopeptidase